MVYIISSLSILHIIEFRVGIISQAKLAVGTEAHKLKVVVIGQAIDKHQIRSDVAIAVIAPFPCQRMIEITAGQGSISG